MINHCSHYTDVRIRTELCHFSRVGPVIEHIRKCSVRSVADRMAELLMKSTIIESGA